MAVSEFQQKIIREVAPYTVLSEDFVVPDGVRVIFSELSGSLDTKNGSKVKLIWDPAGENKTVFVAFGGLVQKSIDEFLGDGVKVFRVELTNNSATTETMGGSAIGVSTT